MDDDASFLPVVQVEGRVDDTCTPVAPPPAGFNDRQWAFINAYCEDPSSGEAAAIEAGYGKGAANMASRMLLTPKFQEEIERRVKAGRGSMLLLARNRLLKIIEHSADDRAAVAAALGLFDRCGMSVPRGPVVSVQNNNLVVNGTDASATLRLVAERAQARLERKAE